MKSLIDLIVDEGIVGINDPMLIEALTTGSWVVENSKHKTHSDNSRLALLGGHVLSLIVSEASYSTRSSVKDTSKLISTARSVEVLGNLGKTLGVGSKLRMGHGARSTGEGDLPSVNASALRALVAVVFVRTDFETTRDFVSKHLLNRLLKAPSGKPKSELQQWVQKTYSGDMPVYQVLEEAGPAHQRVFKVGVFVKGRRIGIGRGASKKQAEKNAALHALERIEEHNRT